MQVEKYSVEDLLYLMARLRDPERGCPWDLKQNFSSIVPSTIEEAYEVAEAIETEDYEHLNEELGDLLFQVVFYAQLGSEAGYFDFSSIVDTLVRKLLRRHPHVFPDGNLYSDNRAEGVDELKVKENWEAIKAAERGGRGETGTLDGIAFALPALTRAVKLQKRAAGVGFDWKDISGVLDKIEEEIAELRKAIESNDSVAVGEELGDLLFSCVNAARHLQLDPETVLRQTNRKFERRFSAVEAELKKKGRRPVDADPEELNQLWDQVKSKERQVT